LDEAGHRSNSAQEQDDSAAAAAASNLSLPSCPPVLPQGSASEFFATPLLVTDIVEAGAVQLMRRNPQLKQTLLELMRQHVTATKLAQLRRCALVPGLLIQSLSFLPVGEQLRAGQVSKEWRVAVQHPTHWRSSGWWCTRYFERLDAMPLPAWLFSRLPVLRCSLNWLLHADSLAELRSFSQLRHLDLERISNGVEATVSASQLRQALSPLLLQSLLLPFWSPLPGELLVALTQPSEQGQPSLMVQWAASLTHLQCEVRPQANDAMLRALSNTGWPLLQRIGVNVCSTEEDAPDEADVAAVRQQLQCWWSPQAAPPDCRWRFNCTRGER